MAKTNDTTNPKNRPEDNNRDGQKRDAYNISHQSKLATHERDQHKCLTCREEFEDPSHLDVDHITPRGAGGGDIMSNQASLCRRCHEAKHGERDHAPTIRWTTTGDMPQKDFRWYRAFWNDILPVLTELAVDHRVKPMRDLSNEIPYQARHIPLGDVRRLDELLAKCDDTRYNGFKAYRFM